MLRSAKGDITKVYNKSLVSRPQGAKGNQGARAIIGRPTGVPKEAYDNKVQ